MKYTLPDGSTYELPDSDWKIVCQLKADWEKSNSPKPFPLYAKITRSITNEDGRHQVKITIPPENKGEKSQITYVTVTEPLTHGFRMGSKSREDSTPVLYALQQAETQDQDTQYFHHVPYKSRPDKNILRVKWALPEPNSEPKSVSCVYKTYQVSDEVNASDIQDIGIWLAPPMKVGGKMVAFLEYRGPDLWKYLEDPTVDKSPQKLLFIAKQCCERIRALNEGTLIVGGAPCLANDVKLQNFTILADTVSLIDDGSVAPIESSGNQKKTDGYTDKYAAPEVFQSKGLKTSIASDIFSLGKALALMAEKLPNNYKEKKELLCLIRLMTDSEPTRRITHQNIEHWFALQESNSELTQNLNNTSVFQQQAFHYCLEHFPHVSMSEKFLSSLFSAEKGPAIACTILGAAEYFSSKPSVSLFHHHGSHKRPEQLIQSLLEEKEDLNFEKMNQYITPAIEKSRDNPHSRKTIMNKYRAIAKKFESPDPTVSKAKPLTADHQKLILQLNHYFPKQHQQWEKIVDNPVLFSIIKKSIEYLKSNPGWHGKISVCKLVESLLSDSFQKKNTQSMETKMQKEVGKCINESAMRYKFLWFIPRKSSEDKEKSRNKLLGDVAMDVIKKVH